jgi:hypothetical protein
MISKKEIVGSKKYSSFLKNLVNFLEQSRRQAAQVVNTVLTATYWETGRRIIEFEQHGKNRAEYGKELLKHISKDLNKRFGRGFSVDNLETMRLFYKAYPLHKISETLSRKLTFRALRELRGCIIRRLVRRRVVPFLDLKLLCLS